jgi:hypothetical protein
MLHKPGNHNVVDIIEPRTYEIADRGPIFPDEEKKDKN